MTALALAAIWYAENGWKVHPCRPRDKRPMLAGWREKVTSETATVERWWNETPAANIGIATGAGFGIWVLDVDGPEGDHALAALEREHGKLPELYPTTFTGGNGWQVFFAWPEGREIRNSASKVGPSIDVRGEGGYVIVPPSVHPSGRTYRWALDRNPRHLPPVPAPAWLVDLAAPPPAPEGARGAFALDRPEVSASYILKAYEAELLAVAGAPQGRRNEQLNQSAYAMFRFCTEGYLSGATVADGLRAAAQHAGLTSREAISTIQSAARARGVHL